MIKNNKIKNLKLDNIDLIIFDFDGVLTNNNVYLDQKGNEFVACNRSDGMGFVILNKIKKKVYIVSTEKNKVVEARAKKLKVPVLYGVSKKSEVIKKLSKKKNLNLKRTFYIGNDLNDYEAMKLCGYSACPSDSHEYIKKIATFVLDAKGGSGVVRELLEKIFNLNLLKFI